MSADSASQSHLSNEELAAYLDRRLDAATMARVESHMANCRDCRADLVEVRALLAPEVTGASARRISRFAGPRPWLAAAIVLIALAPLIHRAVRSRGDADRVRASLSRPAVEVIAPRRYSGGAPGLVFTWRAVAGASAYRLTIADSAGVPLVTRMTSDTTSAVPLGDRIQLGHAYLWYVDCLTRDGRTVSSGIRAISLPR
jgi:anti-sigma factor RsiW